MFGISFEHLLIVGVILLIVGPRRLPELGNTMGKAIKNFKDSFSGIEEASFKRISENEKPKSETEQPVSDKSTRDQPKTQSPLEAAPDASTLSQKVAESTLAPGPAETRDHFPPPPPAV